MESSSFILSLSYTQLSDTLFMSYADLAQLGIYPEDDNVHSKNNEIPNFKFKCSLIEKVEGRYKV